jgi:hypothetical protein
MYVSHLTIMVTKKEVKYVASFLVDMFRNDVLDAWMT